MKRMSQMTCAAALAVFTAAASAQGGMYLRGDVGASFARNASIKDKTPGVSFNNQCDGAGTCGFELDDVGSSFAGTVGLGYTFNKSFRADVTATFRPNFELDDGVPVPAFFGFPASTDQHKADIDNTTVMVSAYFDFPMVFGGLTPYIGGGIGYSRNELETTTVTNPVTGLVRTHGGDTESGLAWQFTAGAAAELQPNLLVDVSYKYVDMGDIDSGATAVNGTVGGFPFGPIPFNGVSGDLSSHEVSVGMRYKF